MVSSVNETDKGHFLFCERSRLILGKSFRCQDAKFGRKSRTK